jgi:hypothetical protein
METILTMIIGVLTAMGVIMAAMSDLSSSDKKGGRKTRKLLKVF